MAILLQNIGAIISFVIGFEISAYSFPMFLGYSSVAIIAHLLKHIDNLMSRIIEHNQQVTLEMKKLIENVIDNKSLFLFHRWIHFSHDYPYRCLSARHLILFAILAHLGVDLRPLTGLMTILSSLEHN